MYYYYAGLGNKFLGNVRECDALVHLVRCFDQQDIIHVQERFVICLISMIFFGVYVCECVLFLVSISDICV